MKITQIRRMKRKQAMRGSYAKLTLTSLIDIFTLLVCFLLVGFQGEVQIPSIKGLALPISNSYIPPENALTIVVTPTEIRINEKTVQPLNGAVTGPLSSGPASSSAQPATVNVDPEQAAAALDLTPLSTALAEQAVRFKPAQTINGSPERTVIILADQQIPYAILQKIMVVCSQQHFGHISFAVNKEAKKNA